jgi:hypothetical protein
MVLHHVNDARAHGTAARKSHRTFTMARYLARSFGAMRLVNDILWQQRRWF